MGRNLTSASSTRRIAREPLLTRLLEAGRKRVIRSLRRNWSDWEILIKDHHEGYITWAEFERNQQLIADNANGMSYLGRGSVRRGRALLPGLFRCARWGRKLKRIPAILKHSLHA